MMIFTEISFSALVILLNVELKVLNVFNKFSLFNVQIPAFDLLYMITSYFIVYMFTSDFDFEMIFDFDFFRFKLPEISTRQ